MYANEPTDDAAPRNDAEPTDDGPMAVDERYRAIVSDVGPEVVIYDTTNEEAWIRSTLAIDIGV